MKTKYLSTIASFALALSCFAKGGDEQSRSTVASDGEPVVQLAILLDTSGSMEGLIAQAKTQLWKIVNQFIAAKQGGKVPIVQVALYEYGNSGLSQDTQWIRQIQPLTRDLDKICAGARTLRVEVYSCRELATFSMSINELTAMTLEREKELEQNVSTARNRTA